MIGYAKYFDVKKTISFKVTNKQLLKKYNKIWGKVEELLNVKFESKPDYGDDDTVLTIIIIIIIIIIIHKLICYLFYQYI